MADIPHDDGSAIASSTTTGDDSGVAIAASSTPSVEVAVTGAAPTHQKGASSDFSFLMGAFGAPSQPSSNGSSLPSVDENGHTRSASINGSANGHTNGNANGNVTATATISLNDDPFAAFAPVSSQPASSGSHKSSVSIDFLGAFSSPAAIAVTPATTASEPVGMVESHHTTVNPQVTDLVSSTNDVVSSNHSTTVNPQVTDLISSHATSVNPQVTDLASSQHSTTVNPQVTDLVLSSPAVIADEPSPRATPAVAVATSSLTSSDMKETKELKASLPPVWVAARVRPFNAREQDIHSELIVEAHDNVLCLYVPANAPISATGRRGSVFTPTASATGGMGNNDTTRWATLDRVWWSHDGKEDPKVYTSQRDVWDQVGEPIRDEVLAGHNVAVLACGATGAGKVYTTLGYGVERGVIPLVYEDLCHRVPNLTTTVSMVEIYIEGVYDLLGDRAAVKVVDGELRGDTKRSVANWDDIERVMESGNVNRCISATKMNATASRGHVITIMEFKWDDHRARLLVADMCASESTQGQAGVQMKEAVAINTSVTALGACISAVAAGTKPSFRDSAITKVLQSCLQGSGRCVVLAALSPSEHDFEATQTQLRWLWGLKKLPCAATPPARLRGGTRAAGAPGVVLPPSRDVVAPAPGLPPAGVAIDNGDDHNDHDAPAPAVAAVTSNDSHGNDSEEKNDAITATPNDDDTHTDGVTSEVKAQDAPATAAAVATAAASAAPAKTSRIAVPAKTGGAAAAAPKGKTAPKAGAKRLPGAPATTATTGAAPKAAAVTTRPSSAKAPSSSGPKAAVKGEAKDNNKPKVGGVKEPKKPSAPKGEVKSSVPVTPAKPKVERPKTAHGSTKPSSTPATATPAKPKVERPKTAVAAKKSGPAAAVAGKKPLTIVASNSLATSVVAHVRSLIPAEEEEKVAVNVTSNDKSVVITRDNNDTSFDFDYVTSVSSRIMDTIGSAIIGRSASGNSCLVTFSTPDSQRDALLVNDLIPKIVDGLFTAATVPHIRAQIVVVRGNALFDVDGKATSQAPTPRVSVALPFIEVKSSDDVLSVWRQAEASRAVVGGVATDSIVALLEVSAGGNVSTIAFVSVAITPDGNDDTKDVRDHVVTDTNALVSILSALGDDRAQDMRSGPARALTSLLSSSMSVSPYVATIACLTPLASYTTATGIVLTSVETISRKTCGVAPTMSQPSAASATTAAQPKAGAKPKVGGAARPKTAGVTRPTTGTSSTPATAAPTQTPRKPGLPERPKTAAPTRTPAKTAPKSAAPAKTAATPKPAKVAAKTAATTPAPTPLSTPAKPKHATSAPAAAPATGEVKEEKKEKKEVKGSAASRIAAKRAAYATLPAGFSPTRNNNVNDPATLAATRSRPTATGSPAKQASTVRIRGDSPPPRTANGVAPAPGSKGTPARRASAFAATARPKSASGGASPGGATIRPDFTTVIALRPWNEHTANGSDRDYASSTAPGVINTTGDVKAYRFDHVLQYEEKAVTGAPTTRLLRDAVVSGRDVLVLAYGAAPFFPRLSNGAYASLPLCWADDLFAAEAKFQITLSVLELSQSRITDLLPKSKTPLPPLKVVKSPIGTVVQGAVTIPITSQEQLESLIADVESRRKVVSGFPLGHIAYFFTITGGPIPNNAAVRSTYVELALGDKAAKKELTGNDLKAHTDVVASLAALSHCLSRARGFRDSTFTSVFEDQLSGTAKTHVVLVASVARSERDIIESKATLAAIAAVKPIKAPAAARAAELEAAAAAAEAKLSTPATAATNDAPTTSAPAPVTTGVPVVRRGAVSKDAPPPAAVAPVPTPVVADAPAAAVAVVEEKAVVDASATTVDAPVAVAAVATEPVGVAEASDDDRNALMTYLSQPETTLLANTEIHATLGDVDAIIHSAGGIQQAIEILTTLDRSGRKFMGLDTIAPAIREFLASSR